MKAGGNVKTFKRSGEVNRYYIGHKTVQDWSAYTSIPSFKMCFKRTCS